MLKYEEAVENAMEIVRKNGRNPRNVDPSVRAVYLISDIEFEVANGGVVQWLTNSSGRYAADTVRAFEEIGARQCAEIVRSILSFFPANAPAEDDDVRTKQVSHLLPVAAQTWNACGSALLKWPDDIDALLRKLVVENESNFVVMRE